MCQEVATGVSQLWLATDVHIQLGSELTGVCAHPGWGGGLVERAGKASPVFPLHGGQKLA